MSVIDDYLARLSPGRRAPLEHIRAIVKATVPDAEEVISYGMPAFRYKRKFLVGFNAFASHFGLYPTPGPIEAFKDRLEGFTLAKGTIQFTSDHPVPDPLLIDIITKRKINIDKE